MGVSAKARLSQTPLSLSLVQSSLLPNSLSTSLEHRGMTPERDRVTQPPSLPNFVPPPSLSPLDSLSSPPHPPAHSPSSFLPTETRREARPGGFRICLQGMSLPSSPTRREGANPSRSTGPQLSVLPLASPPLDRAADARGYAGMIRDNGGDMCRQTGSSAALPLLAFVRQQEEVQEHTPLFGGLGNGCG